MLKRTKRNLQIYNKEVSSIDALPMFMYTRHLVSARQRMQMILALYHFLPPYYTQYVTKNKPDWVIDTHAG